VHVLLNTLQLPLPYRFFPAKTESNQLMVVLHGLGDSPKGFLWLPNALRFDSLNYLLITAPDPYYDGFSWYNITANPLEGIVRSRRLLGEVFAVLSKSGYPPELTFMLGFSQGCLMTLEFGARHQHKLAGYVGISGYSIDPETLVRELNPDVNRGNWLVTHGLYDELIPVDKVREQMKVLQDGGFAIDYREYPKSHTIDPERELPEIREWIRQRV
jgi:phospholipase/carboxylesterase